MPRVNRAVMGAEQPTFEQCDHTVNARQWLMSRHLGAEDDVRIVIESFNLEAAVDR